MKTITVTFHHTTNYGAVLQSYALQQTLLSLGHDNLILETKEGTEGKRRTEFNLKAFIRRRYLRLLYKLRKEEFESLKYSFRKFHEEKLLLTKPYSSMEELKTDVERNEEVMIAGSDQVWNLKTVPQFVESRFLTFGREDAIRFSYAASLEELDYSDEQRSFVKKNLMNFKGISLREDSAKRYIEEITGKNCKRVLDPVFLLSKDQWKSLAKEPRYKGDYILCYQVQRNNNISKVAKILKKKYGCPIIAICNSPIRWMKADYYFHDVSIEEFIGFYLNARVVVSASFHGVALGLSMLKPTYAMIKSVRSNRIKEIMDLFDLNRYVIKQDDKVKDLSEYNSETLIRLHDLKENWVEKSRSFLIDMLDK